MFSHHNPPRGREGAVVVGATLVVAPVAGRHKVCVWNRNRLWLISYLRTTSRLECTNRAIRRYLRCAGAYHLREGLQAALAQVLIQTRISTEKDTL